MGINAATPDGTPPVNTVVQSVDWGGPVLPDGTVKNEGTTYFCHDIDSGKTNRAITFDGFMNAHIDIVIASIPQHIEPFRKLCELHPDHPKLIYQIGNAWNIPPGIMVKNVMASAIIHDPIPPGTNFISYHQEFDSKIFSPRSDYSVFPGPKISSFVNCFSIDGLFTKDWQLFQRVELLLGSWGFKSYGGQCRDGSKGPADVLADAMRDSAFIWHTKWGGDGYGHIIHNAAALGRPMITKIGYYMGKMGFALMKDGETCIAIDGLEPEDIVAKILHYSEPSRYRQMCENVTQNFEQVVNFDREFEDLKLFLKNLL